MKLFLSSEHNEQDRKTIQLLQDLGSLKATYPPELLAARRAAFLAQLEQLSPAEAGEELSAEDQEIVKLLGQLKLLQVEYPADLLAARRATLLRQIERAETTSIWAEFRTSIQRFFQSRPKVASNRLSLVVVSLLAALCIGSLLFSRVEQSFRPSPSQAAAAPTQGLPTSSAEVALTICDPEDQTSPCSLGGLAPSQDLADWEYGIARPAISKDAQANPAGGYKAAYVNDGRGGASWVSNSADSWIKIDLGEVTTINTVSLKKGSAGTSGDNNPGQFVIAVALSDMYVDGDSNNDSREYAQVFHSEQTDFSGKVSQAETIETRFPPVKARFVKITFEKAGAAIEEVGVFLVRSPVLSEQPTRESTDDLPTVTLTPVRTNTSSPTDPATSVSTGTAPSTLTSAVTLTPLPTNTFPPTDTATPAHTDTPVPPPTIGPPTDIPPDVQPSPAVTGPIVVTGNDQILTFICNGVAAEIRGRGNTVTLLGSCSTITVTGNGNRVFWEFGSPVISDQGKDNIIQQLRV